MNARMTEGGFGEVSAYTKSVMLGLVPSIQGRLPHIALAAWILQRVLG